MSQNSEPKNNKPRPIPVINIRLNFMSDGGVDVNGFPDDFVQAMACMASATRAVAAYFVRGAADNRHDANGRKKSGIVIAPAAAIGKN